MYRGIVSSIEPADFDPGDLKRSAPLPVKPATSQPPQPPGGAIARCVDGSYVLAAHPKGVCFGHGGVAERLR
jgi:hypothetical protein